MPNTPMTFTPELAVNEAGQEYLTGEGTLTPTRAGGTIQPPVEIDELTGETRYLVDEQDYAQDGDAAPDVDDSYVEAIFETYPH